MQEQQWVFYQPGHHRQQHCGQEPACQPERSVWHKDSLGEQQQRRARQRRPPEVLQARLEEELRSNRLQPLGQQRARKHIRIRYAWQHAQSRSRRSVATHGQGRLAGGKREQERWGVCVCVCVSILEGGRRGGDRSGRPQ